MSDASGPGQRPSGPNLLRELARIGIEFQRLRSEAAIFDTMADRLLPFGYRSAIYGVDGDTFTLLHLRGNPGNLANVERALGRTLQGMTLPLTDSASRMALQTRRPQYTPRFETGPFPEPEVATIVRRQATNLHGIYAPLPLGEHRQGLLLVYGEQIGPEDVDAIGLFASAVGSALENARLYNQLERRVADLSLVADVSETVIGPLDLATKLGTAAMKVAQIIDASNAFFMLWDEAGRRLIGIAATPPFEAEAPSLLIDPDEPSLVARCFRENRPLAIEDTEQSTAEFHRTYAAQHAQKALLALPLRTRNGRVGVVLLGDTRGPRQFTSTEIERAGAIANQVAVAIENARLNEDQRRAYEQLRATQAELVRRERLAALGELSAVVAHEVRNPLGVIFNSIGSLRRTLDLKGDAARLLDIVAEEAEHLNRLVTDLLDFARPREPALKPAPLGEVIDEVIASASQEAGAAVTFERIISPDIPAVPLDRHLIRRALVNVAVNAAQAMPKGGRVSIRVEPDVHGSERWARIDVIDQGPGIPSATLGRVFEPFFTTKATGTGLGLAVVKRIVEDHHGEICIGNDAGSGAKVTVRLPLPVDGAASN